MQTEKAERDQDKNGNRSPQKPRCDRDPNKRDAERERPVRPIVCDENAAHRGKGQAEKRLARPYSQRFHVPGKRVLSHVRRIRRRSPAAKAFDSTFPAYMLAPACRFLFREKVGGTSFARPRGTAPKINVPPASGSSRARIGTSAISSPKF